MQTCSIGLLYPLISLAQPSITTQPESQSVSLGANVTFSVKGTGAAPLNYQWRFTGGKLDGAVTSALSLTNVSASAAGGYLAVVSDAAGLSSTSHVATLSIDPAFTKITSGRVVTDIGLFGGSSWADYDNDGFPDLLVCSFAAGGNFLYRNNGDGTFARINASPIGTDPEHTIRCVWGDYDNDGYLDLFVVNGFAGPEDNVLYHNNGDGTFGKIATGSPVNDGGSSFGVGWADYDNNGFLDLFVANGIRGPAEHNFLYHNNGNNNAWLKIKCVGTGSNRAGIGAKVRVRTTVAGQSRWQMRQIDGGDGTSGGSLEAHFGLRDATTIDALRVEWPSGIVQEGRDLPSRQLLIVTEPAQLRSRGAGVFSIPSGKATVCVV